MKLHHNWKLAFQTIDISYLIVYTLLLSVNSLSEALRTVYIYTRSSERTKHGQTMRQLKYFCAPCQSIRGTNPSTTSAGTQV